MQNEGYHYGSLLEAENHFPQICSLDNDDYFMVQILKTRTNHVIKCAILLGLTEDEISLIREYSRGEQFETIKALLAASIDESSTNVFDLVSARLKVEKLCSVK